AEGVAGIAGVLPGIATADAGRLVLTSPAAGPGSSLAFGIPGPALRLLGLTGEPAQGTDPTAVRVVGTVDLSGGADLPAGAMLAIAIDGGPAVEVPLAPAGPAPLTLDLLVIAINGTLAAPVASRALSL